MTEFIPSPQEKREGLIRDHALGLLENLHQRLARLERASGLPPDEAEAFTALLSADAGRRVAQSGAAHQPDHRRNRLRLNRLNRCHRQPETPDTASPVRGFCRPVRQPNPARTRKSLKINVLNVGFGCSST